MDGAGRIVAVRVWPVVRASGQDHRGRRGLWRGNWDFARHHRRKLVLRLHVEALGAKVATEHPGYIIGNIGDSYGHWLYLWPSQCPISQVTGPSQVLASAGPVLA